MGRYHDLTGFRYGRLVVESYSHSNKHGQPIWNCKCDCGGEKKINAGALRNGLTVSCGCRKKETLDAGRFRHGASSSGVYSTWFQMMQRCNNENHKDYHWYGARGIKVCERWHDISMFVQDMGDRPQGTTLDRIDNEKGYFPDNCRWATSLQQGSNKRNNVHVSADGQTIHVAEFSRRYNIPETTVFRKIKSGMTGDEIVIERKRKRKI